METRLDGSPSGRLPHSVKQWQLDSTDYDRRTVLAVQAVSQTPRGPAAGTSGTRFSAWTPLAHKPSNQQLFHERCSLMTHWFDLWSDTQRKQLLRALLQRCSQSQLKACRDWLMESLPVVRLDFTAVLPRFLGLYILSFLNPRDLSAAAQVCWHWRLLAEQDCLWAGRCVRRGWFLPYRPAQKEYGAWKEHYVSCVSSLDWSPPPPARGAGGEEEEEGEEQQERRLRWSIRERLHQEKALRLRARRPWGSHPPSATPRRPGGPVGGLGPWLSCWSPGGGEGPSTPATPASPPAASRPTTPASCVSQRWGQSEREGERCSSSSFSSCSFVSRPPWPHGTGEDLPVLLVSNSVPAYELVLSGSRSEVLPVLYDPRAGLAALLTQTERALGGRRARRLGLLCPGTTEDLQLVRGASLSECSVRAPDTRDFWEKLCGWVVPKEDGGGVDIFAPLAASARGVALMQSLSSISGLEVLAPAGLATGSFQNILSQWTSSDSSPRARPPLSRGRAREAREELGEEPEEGGAPALCYVREEVLRAWCLQAQWMEEALRDLRGPLENRLHRVSLEVRGRALGHFLWDRVSLEDVCVSPPLTQALVEGLAALNRDAETRPIRSLSVFLARCSEEVEDGQTADAEHREVGGEDTDALPQTGPAPLPELAQMALDWRGAVVKELYRSEEEYQARLTSVFKVYHEPLTAAVDSNRPIIGHASVHVILSPVEQLLRLSRVFLGDLGSRLGSWGPDVCVADVCLKLCSKLRLFVNYLHNYPTALGSVDTCREMIPAFRAFLKRADRTLSTHMLSLPELLLCPSWRLEEYVTLLQALSRHTPARHPDHAHLASALTAATRHRDFVRKMKSDSERDTLMEDAQRLIQGCPNLSEGGRRLIMTQDAALLQSSEEELPDSLRPYQQVCDVGLFLFSDALVLTERVERHTPFSLALRTTHTFLASVALACLDAREITHSRYVQHAFILRGPSRSWACSTERAADAEHFLSALRSAARSALQTQG